MPLLTQCSHIVMWVIPSISVIAPGVGCPHLSPHQVPSLSFEHYRLVVSVSSGLPEQLARGIEGQRLGVGFLAELLGI